MKTATAEKVTTADIGTVDKTPETQALTKPNQTGVAIRPAYIDADDNGAGKEDITRDDMILPRLAICQSMTQQRKKTEATYIEGLEEGDLFNTLTGRIYAKQGKTVTVVPVRIDKQALIFNGSGKGVAEFDVRWDDPRCEFTEGPNGESIKPVATKFYNVLCVIAGTQELVVLGFKSTYFKAGKRLNSLVNGRAGSIYTGAYTIGTVPDKREKGDFFNFTVNYSKENDGWAADADYARAKNLHASLKGKKIVTEPETEDAVEGQVVGDKVEGKEDIPF